MKTYIVEGGKKLEGKVKISGSKNAALPIIAASILVDGITTLSNVPDIQDTKIILQILEFLGCKVTRLEKKGQIQIDASSIDKTEIPEHLMREMRSTVILAGALLGRFNKATFTYPGGCDIGSRPIDLHLKAFSKLGIEIQEDTGFIHCICDRIKPSEIDLDFPSVGATENSMLAATLTDGKTVIINAAMEPEIVDLANCLNKMGAHIEGAGTKQITIYGVERLKETSYTVMPDRIETGTMLCAGAITGGNITVEDIRPYHITPILHKLEEAGCILDIGKDFVSLKAPTRLNSIDIMTMPYPGFPTDMQSVLGATLTLAKGTSVIVENIFENRFKYASELKRMGAKIKIEGKTLIIHGVKKINGASVKSCDLRGGASLVIAALAAKGTTRVENIEYVLRGYESFDEKLRNIGASIKMIEE